MESKPEYLSISWKVRCDGVARKIVIAVGCIAVVAIIGISMWYRSTHGV